VFLETVVWPCLNCQTNALDSASLTEPIEQENKKYITAQVLQTQIKKCLFEKAMFQYYKLELFLQKFENLILAFY